jgi:hypothetical protein
MERLAGVRGQANAHAGGREQSVTAILLEFDIHKGLLSVVREFEVSSVKRLFPLHT